MLIWDLDDCNRYFSLVSDIFKAMTETILRGFIKCRQDHDNAGLRKQKTEEFDADDAEGEEADTHDYFIF